MCIRDSPSTDEKATAERFGWKYYLPEADQEEAVNVKLAEIRSTYKDLKPTDITCIDPCMGSGHILIAMFDVLMDIYESAGYDKREAAFEIVEHNIHGLDIDQRAYQLAYFAVMMKGRGYNRRFLRGRDGKPEPKVYAIVESNEINRNHLQFFGAHLSEMERNLAVTQIEGLLDTFIDAREYGSILNVDVCDWDVLERFVEDLGTVGQISFESVGSEETQESLRKLVRVAKNLGQKYDAVVTNPPYMGASGMGAELSKYVKGNYPNSKSDLFSVFIEKWNTMVNKNGFNCMVTMQSWMFLSSFEKMRVNILNTRNITNLLHMENMVMGIAFGTAVTVFRNGHVQGYKGTYNQIKLCDIVNNKPKYFPVLDNRFSQVATDNFSKIPGSPMAYWISKQLMNTFEHPSIENYVLFRQGMATSDNNRFLRLWHEVKESKTNLHATDLESARHSGSKWFAYNKGGAYRKWYGNSEYVVNWENDGAEMKAYTSTLPQGMNVRLKSREYYFKECYSWSKISSGQISFRYYPTGFAFDVAGCCVFECGDHLLYFLGLSNSVVTSILANCISPTMNYELDHLKKIPVIFNNEKEEVINEIVKKNIILAKTDWDSYETSWDFQKHPLVCKASNLDKIFEQWKEKSGSRFNELKNNEEKLNRIFIDIYGLNEELIPEIEDKDVSVRKADLSRDICSFVSYAVGCMFGRYSLDKEGLIYAGGEWDSSRYKTFIPDSDNCIPITDEEYFSDDIVGRFAEFVKTVYGADTLEENLDFIANALGNKGDTSREVIRNYFLKDFYTDHLKVYQKRPIYWLFDSGKQNGFKALIYMHRYDADTVGRVRTDYLHRAQKYIETAMQSAQYTIDNASSASEKSKATKAVTKYTKQLAEMKIYDEAIAHIANKRIEIDLDDGVKVNYEKFQGVEVAQEGKKALKVDLLAKLK